MSAPIEVGAERVLKRPTFLHEGVFVNPGTQVKVMEVTDQGLNVQFLDREGFPHVIRGVGPEELS